MFAAKFFKLNNFLFSFVVVLFGLFFSVTNAQTTYTESAASYGLNIGGNKDGGHAWSDYDNDGDIDVLVLENVNGATRSYLMRNNGNNTFTDVRATLVPGMPNDRAERQAAWGDLNSDGLPDFMITSSGSNSSVVAIQIYIQNTNGTFGNGIGGTAPITVGENSSETITINPLNVEGAGFFDFEGDGDLDIFFDNHGSGIELLLNNYVDHVTHLVTNPTPANFFTHITPGNGPGVVQFGLNQFATDGDYGSAADVNDDGWVDIFMRKRDENDFFLNQGGTFTNGSDLAQAANGNKGGNGLWDLDNDGDLDAVWTENGLNQIFRNDGPGVWTALGAVTFPGLPQPPNGNNSSSSNDIDALAGGDIDNDGDIDILFVGDSRSYLFINQLNSPTPAPGVIGSGSAMTFTLDSEPFNSGRNGEGTTMIDIDDDGDLDIYMSISGTSQLFINNLPAANRNNHLIIDVTEDRGANGATGGAPERTAIGTNVIIRDCNGNIISGLRQVNGVFGHGTQSPESVHFGLPLGENETYTVEIRYPNFYDPVEGFHRLIGTIIATPSTIPGTNHYSINSSEAELSENINAPDAVDDLITVSVGTTVSVQLNLFDNDSDADGHDFFIESIVQPAVGSVVIDDADAGLVTYTYSAGTLFPGATFDYTISDSPVGACPALGKFDTANVIINEPCADPTGIDTDGDGINDICDLDDDNDGVLDCDESSDSIYDGYFAWNLNNPSGNLTMDTTNDPDILNWVLDSTTDYTWNSITANTSSGGSNLQITNILFSSLGEAVANDSYLQVSFTTSSELINPSLNQIESGWFMPREEDSYSLSLAISDDNFTTSEFLSTDVFITDSSPSTPYLTYDLMESSSYTLKPNTTYTVRVYIYGQINDSSHNFSVFDDLQFYMDACRAVDSDLDGTPDHLDFDSDDDGCTDADEAYITTLNDADPDDDGIYGTGTPTVDNNGQVIGAAYTNPDLFFQNDNVNACTDTDNDNVPDIVDLDDDNDGILDTDEMDCSGTVDSVVDFNIQGGNLNSINDGNNAPDSGIMLNNTSHYLVLDLGSILTVGSSINFTLWTNVNDISGNKTLRLTQLTNATFISNGGTNPLEINDTQIAAATEVSSFVYVLSLDTQYLQIEMTSRSRGRIEVIEANTCIDFNTDTDSQVDRLDTDSDNDGCNDANEAYTNSNADSNGDGTFGDIITSTGVNLNGLVTSAGIDGTGRAYTTTPATSTISSEFTFQEAGTVPTITLEPTNQQVFLPDNGTFNLSATDANTYQWQLSTNGGTTFTDINDGTEYSGTTTDALTVISPDYSKNGFLFRVVLINSNYVCSEEISNQALLTVSPRTVITNRRITFRVKRN